MPRTSPFQKLLDFLGHLEDEGCGIPQIIFTRRQSGYMGVLGWALGSVNGIELGMN